jgi:hypothetical protein
LILLHELRPKNIARSIRPAATLRESGDPLKGCTVTQTTDYTFEPLDTRDTASLDAYEQALYRAFSHSYIRTLDRIWHIDHTARRIRTKVAYDKQTIYVARRDAEIIAGTAVNFDLAGTLQLELMDFTIDKSEPGLCEALHVFNLNDPLRSLEMMRKMYVFLMRTLTAMGMRTIYATCSQKRLRSYQFLGFSVADQHLFQGEQKYLLKQHCGHETGIGPETSGSSAGKLPA